MTLFASLGAASLCRLSIAAFTRRRCLGFIQSRCLHLPHQRLHRLNSRVAQSITRKQPHRCMYIQTQSTPNVNALKFMPGRRVLPQTTTAADGTSAPATDDSQQQGTNQTLDLRTFRDAQAASPLAAALFQIEGVQGVLLGSDFIAVNIADATQWSIIKPAVFASIMDFFASGQPVLLPEGTQAAAESSAHSDTMILDTDSEVVAMIKELIETRIRPSVQEDGGDIAYRGFDEQTGVVQVQMQGSCVGCASSAVTLKHGIENMLMHYVPEVKEVREWKDEVLETVSQEQLSKLEQQLKETTDKAQRNKSNKAKAATPATNQ